MTMQRPAVLSIAGSDSGGGAGIQADLRVFTALGVYGTSAITCLTAQNPAEVAAVEPVSPALITAQIDAVCRGFPIVAAKTGMLFSAPIIDAVANALRRARIPRLVVDPVMVATSGARLLQPDAVTALCERIFPEAAVLTPNRQEAEILWGQSISNMDELRHATVAIAQRYGCACVGKGGHLESGDGLVHDVFYDGCTLHECTTQRIAIADSHGTGCSFSAAVCALLAHAIAPPDAVRRAQAFVAGSLAAATPVGAHQPMDSRPLTLMS